MAALIPIPDSSQSSAEIPATQDISRTNSLLSNVPLIERVAFEGFQKVLSQMENGRLEVHSPNHPALHLGKGENGPFARIDIHDPRFFARCLRHGDIGLGESYQDGWWDSPDPSAVVGWFCANASSSPTMAGSRYKNFALSTVQWIARSTRLIQHRLRRNSLSGSRKNIRAHYDLGNEFYSIWLDPTLTYSSAIFTDSEQSLMEAQLAKYDRLCRQLRLQPKDHVLEIGSGWGGFACHAVANYGCQVTTLTLSKEQARFAENRFKQQGIDHRAEVRLMDYRHLTGQFDKIVSIEMLEAVGDNFLETYFTQINKCLRPDGLFAAQFITCPDNRYDALRRGVDWIQRHIFPGSLLLSLNRVQNAMQRTGDLQLHDLRDIGADYARTLNLWQQSFQAGIDQIQALGFDNRFIRTWTYYLAYCQAAFAWRNISVIQGLWTRPNNRNLMS